MHSSILTATLFGLVISTVPVAAEQLAVGEVKSYDRGARTFSVNGVPYSLPLSYPAVGLSNGSKVSISWQQSDDRRLVRHLRIDEISHDK